MIARSERMLSAGWPWVWGALLLSSLGGCGSKEVDHRDELGLESDAAEEPYELVIVEAPRAEEREEEAGQDSSTLAVVYDARGAFTVQVGVYSSAEMARKMVRELSTEGYPAYAIAQPDKKGIRVRIGYFVTRADAERFGNRFKQDRGMDFWIDRRSNETF